MSTASPGRFLHPFASTTRTSFVEIVDGEGATVTTADGRELIDAMASLWYCNVGHGRREIAEAVAEQLSKVAGYSCFDPFTNPTADRLADRVAALAPMDAARVFLCCSGSEAIDTALKLARTTFQLTGEPDRTIIISREGGYHGTNLGGTSAQGIELNRAGWGPLVPEVMTVPADDIEALSVLMAEHGDRVAAVLSEPVQGAAGVNPPPDGYLDTVRALCDRHGALMILDEVITGFGRLGTWFGAEHYGVTPDLVTFAKAVTSGYQPIGGVIVGGRVRAALEAEPDYILRHGYTYSGHAAGCAAALANIDILEREELLPRAVAMGGRLSDGLRALADDGVLAEVRGVGAVWAAGLQPDRPAADVRAAMLERGVIVRAVGDSTITFCPPLVTTDAQVDKIVDALQASVAP